MLTAWLTGAAPADSFLILLLALALDAAFGDPPWLYRAIPHPVVMIGKLVELGERWLNDLESAEVDRLNNGTLIDFADFRIVCDRADPFDRRVDFLCR